MYLGRNRLFADKTISMFNQILFSEFPVDRASVRYRVEQINPLQYGKTRNFIDGAVTRLSPYISRGIITLPEILDHVLSKGYGYQQIEKFIQELCWREFFQRVWWEKRDMIFEDLKQPQQNVAHYQIPRAVVEARTGIEAIDRQIREWHKTGYLHNHVRMYIASIVCNVGQSHWKLPSKWMYYHLLDGDPASNTCSWQWVAGSFSSKKYYANQENINRYLHSNQIKTFLDFSYEELATASIPDCLTETIIPELKTLLPEKSSVINIDPQKTVCIYTSYWLNPEWRSELDANRILLIEPSHFQKHPVSKTVMDFIILAAKENIAGIQIFVGEFSELKKLIAPSQATFYLDHPLHKHFIGNADPYPWMFPEVKGNFSSFFSFWKKVEKYVRP